MKFTASVLTVFAASILLLQSCGSDTTTERAELATILDEAAESGHKNLMILPL